MKQIMLRRIEMAKTKIVVIQLKEIIYTVIFAALGILLILLLIFMFWPDKKDEVASNSSALYIPGKYTSSIALNDTAINLEVVLDEDHINSVRIMNIDETITTMFPLVEPSLELIKEQLYKDVPIDQLELKEDSKYTQTLLIEAIKMAIDKAKPTPTP
jgi:cbb3-type cytochrome oxidase subunit 3